MQHSHHLSLAPSLDEAGSTPWPDNICDTSDQDHYFGDTTACLLHQWLYELATMLRHTYVAYFAYYLFRKPPHQLHFRNSQISRKKMEEMRPLWPAVLPRKKDLQFLNNRLHHDNVSDIRVSWVSRSGRPFATKDEACVSITDFPSTC
jgi:hypothetical protein